MIFHHHRWEVVERAYAPPTLHNLSSSRTDLQMSEVMAERLICGVTTWLLRCEKCGAVRKETALGQVHQNTA